MPASCTCTGGVLLLRGVLACATCNARVPIAAGTTRHTQRDAERPVGAGRAKYLRIFRRAIEAGDVEAWREGRSLCMTPAAWSRWARTDVARKRVVKLEPKARTVADDVLTELGAARRTG